MELTGLLPLILCCAVVILAAGAVLGSETPGRRRDALAVMTFNIRFHNPDDGENAWPHRRDRVAEVIRMNRADLFGLQEALQDQVADLEQRLPEYTWYGLGREDGKERGEFVPIFYRKDRFDVLDNAVFWLSETPARPGSRGWDATIPRATTWVKLRDKQTGGVLFAFNTHLDHWGAKARDESARLLLAKIEKIAGPEPAVLTGDFNCTPSSRPYRILTTGTDDPDERGEFSLTDARGVSESEPAGPDSTWNGFREITPGLRIDFIFLSGPWRVRSYQILDERNDGRFASDHLPVIAELIAESESE